MSEIIRFSGVSLGYGRRLVLEDVNFVLGKGEKLGIVGPNGGGKTTLLRAILGILKPKRGKAEWPGPARPRIGYVPQRQRLEELFPLTAFEIAMMGRCREIGLLSRPSAKDADAVNGALDTVGLAESARSFYRDLSGGQKQRCLIARAISGGPELLVLDEPTADMDIEGESRILELVSALGSERGLTVIIVSHALNVIINHVERVAVVQDGAFRLFAVDELLREETLAKVYGVSLSVCTVEGRRFVVPRN